MSDTSTPSQVPGSTPLGPWDFAQFLRRTAGQQTVVKGAGGAYFVIDTAQTRFTMEEASVQWNPSKTTVKTNDPTLDEPNFAGLGLWSTQFSQTVITIMFGTPTEQSIAVDSISGGDSLLEALQFQQQAMQTFFEETGIEGPSTLSPSITTNTAFIEWLTQLKSLVPKDPVFLSAEATQILTAMHSSDESTVYAELVNLADLQALSLTGQQKATIMDRLQKLAKAIAEKNAIGGASVLNMTIPVLMLAAFADTIGLSTDITTSKATKEALFAALSKITSTLASVNFEKLTNQKPADQAYVALTSGDAQQVSQALSLLTGGYTPPAGVSSSDVSAALSSIANTIASLSPDERKVLESTDRDALTALFSKALESAASSGIISEEVKKALLASLVPLLVDKTFDVNFAEHSEGLKSTNGATIRTALLALTGIDTGSDADKRLTKTTRTVAMSYIQALIDMLKFMAQVRCFISTSQGELSEKLNKAKIASLDEEIQTAAELYKAQLAKMRKTYEKNLAAIKLQELMKTLMPLISIGMSFLMLVIAAGFLISSIFSFGAAAPPEAALMSGLIASIVGAISAGVSLVLTCIDSGLQLAGKTSMWTDLAKALGITNASEQAAFIAGFQFLIQLVTVVVSGGTILALNALKTAAKEAAEIGSTRGAEAGVGEAAKAGSAGAAAGAAGGAAGAIAKTGAGAAAKGTTSEVAEVSKEASTGTTKLAIQQIKGLGIKAAWKAGTRAISKTARELTKDELADIIWQIVKGQIIIGTVSSILGSGLVTQGLIKLGKLIFHNEKDAMIFAILMTIVVMIAGTMIAGYLTGTKTKAPTGGAVKAKEPVSSEAVVSLAPEITAPTPKPVALGPETTPPPTPTPAGPKPQVSAPLPVGPPSKTAPSPSIGAPRVAPAPEGVPAPAAAIPGEAPAGVRIGGPEAEAPTTGAVAAGGPGQVPGGAVPETAAASAAPAQLENVGAAPAAPAPGAPGITPTQGARQVSTVPSGEHAATPTSRGEGEGAPAGVAGEAAGQPVGAGEPGQPVAAAAPAAPGQPVSAPVEGAAVPTAPKEPTPSSAAAKETGAPGHPQEKAPGGKTAEQPQVEVMAGPPAPGGAGPQPTGGERGVADASTQIKIKDAAPTLIRKLREMFSSVLRAILKELGVTEKKIDDLATTENFEVQLAAIESESVRGGVPALTKFAKKLLRLLNTLGAKMKESGTGETVKLSGTVAQEPFFASLRRKILNLLKDLCSVLTDAVFAGGEGGLDKITRAFRAWADILKMALMATKIATGVAQYRAKMRESELEKFLAQLELETSQLKAMMQLFTQLAGTDQTQTIQDLADDMSKQFNNWTSLLEIVSSFIEGAGEQVSELARKANR